MSAVLLGSRRFGKEHTLRQMFLAAPSNTILVHARRPIYCRCQGYGPESWPHFLGRGRCLYAKEKP